MQLRTLRQVGHVGPMQVSVCAGAGVRTHGLMEHCWQRGTLGFPCQILAQWVACCTEIPRTACDPMCGPDERVWQMMTHRSAVLLCAASLHALPSRGSPCSPAAHNTPHHQCLEAHLQHQLRAVVSSSAPYILLQALVFWAGAVCCAGLESGGQQDAVRGSPAMFAASAGAARRSATPSCCLTA